MSVRQMAVMCVLVLFALGGKPVMQSIAWAGMLVAYSKTDGVSQAIDDTFSGLRPCNLCRAIDLEDTDKPSLSERRFELLRLETTEHSMIDLDRLLTIEGREKRLVYSFAESILLPWISEPLKPPPQVRA